MKYIIFLKAINVGGNRKIKMADLKVALRSEGYLNITTYIQSGNIIAEREESDHEIIQKEVEALIKKHFGFDVPAVAFNVSEYEEVLKRNPFDGDKLMVHFLNRIPEQAMINKLEQLSQDNQDKSAHAGRFLYISLNAGVSDSLFSNKLVEKVLQVRATARNWNTVLKMIDKANGK
ncbi:DUF1697 domain-containing protein [Listeria sp. FSL L7-1582]|uniref:DUF1697 domain-containing protein n=1 Tax=Listeria portnoyi TaxID=2713504 RepID=UPI00164D95F2|nr:DUF1697 domain-containing protein [Listeria portnoyi]MBC6310921.1 DUF1697 domain-containing protein [Listeria portnoyi]